MKMEGVTLPAFPTFDIAPVAQWFMTGATEMLKSNAMWLIVPGLVIAAVFGAVALIKRTGKKAVKG